MEGKQCILPFNYRNVSDDGTITELTYTRCTTLDIYKPWCPTGTYVGQYCETSAKSSFFLHY